MELSTLDTVATGTAGIETFLGYNHNLRIGSGEFYDMENLTSDNYPVLTPRKGRAEYGIYGAQDGVYNVTGAVSNGSGVYYTTDTRLITGKDRSVDLGLDPDTEKTLIANGAYILIFPDKKYYNTVDSEDYGSMEMSESYTGIQVYPYDTITEKPFEVFFDAFDSSVHDYGLFLMPGTSGEIVAEIFSKAYSTSGDETAEYELIYTPITSVRVRILLPDTAGKLDIREGDAVEIESNKAGGFDGVCIVESYGEDGVLTIKLDDASGFFKVLYEKKQNTITLPTFTIKRTVPEMDYVLECNNRIWGCRYGMDNKGNFVNELYACKQGDFRNWNYFAGVSIDSYAASCGAAGPFTGAVNFNGRPLFFKQDHYWLVSGDYPSQYGYTDAPIAGVANGSGKSLATINRLLYYHAYDGIRVFDGYDSTNISAVFGGLKYDNATGGAFGDKYYVSLTNQQTQERSLFVYDTVRGLWHRENDLPAQAYFTDRNRLFVVTEDRYIVCTDGSLLAADENRSVYSGLGEEVVSWYAETGDLLPSLSFKFLHSLGVRMHIPDGACVRFLLQYDASGKWEEVYRHAAARQQFVTVPIRPRRCDHLRLRIEGEGAVEIYAISKTYEQGSDRR